MTGQAAAASKYAGDGGACGERVGGGSFLKSGAGGGGRNGGGGGSFVYCSGRDVCVYPHWVAVDGSSGTDGCVLIITPIAAPAIMERRHSCMCASLGVWRGLRETLSRPTAKLFFLAPGAGGGWE